MIAARMLAYLFFIISPFKRLGLSLLIHAALEGSIDARPLTTSKRFRGSDRLVAARSPKFGQRTWPVGTRTVRRYGTTVPDLEWADLEDSPQDVKLLRRSEI
jgi:hypothetical protein